MRELPDDVHCEWCETPGCGVVAGQVIDNTWAVYQDDGKVLVSEVRLVSWWACGNVTLREIDCDGTEDPTEASNFLGFLGPHGDDEVPARITDRAMALSAFRSKQSGGAK